MISCQACTGRARVRALVLLLEGLQAPQMVLVCVCAERLQASRLPSDRDKTCVRTHRSVRTLGPAESDCSSGGGGEGRRGGGVNHFSSYLSVTTALRLCRLVHKSDETRRGITRTSNWKITLLHFYRAA